MALPMVTFYVRIIMTYIVFILSTIFVVRFVVSFSSKPSQIYGGLGLIASGSGIVINFGGLLCLMVSNIYLRGMLLLFSYITTMSTEQYPEV